VIEASIFTHFAPLLTSTAKKPLGGGEHEIKRGGSSLLMPMGKALLLAALICTMEIRALATHRVGDN